LEIAATAATLIGKRKSARPGITASGDQSMDHTEPPGAAISRTTAWFAVAILCLAQVVSTIDRGMLALVIDPVRADLGISEVQIATLQGFAFAVFYVSVGIPLGFVADAVNRQRLLVAGILVWSAATMASGFAENFGHMFAARLGIGVGEAVLGPCAVGIISELFPPDRRGRPMSLYVLGSMVAYGVGSGVTGLILEAVPAGHFAWLPLVAGLAPWRVAFVVVGLAGIPLALLLGLTRDPAPARRGAARPTLSIRATLSEFSERRAIYGPIYAAAALFAAGGSVASGWTAVMVSRLFGLAPAAAGKALGVSQITWAVAGALVAGLVVDRIGRRHGAAGKLVMAAGVMLATIPTTLGFLLPNATLAIVAGGAVMGTSALFGTTLLSIIADIVPARSRGVAVAFYAFVMTMIGGSLGPLAVAGLTQHVFGSPMLIGRSMAIVGVVTLGAGIGACLLAARRCAGLALVRG